MDLTQGKVQERNKFQKRNKLKVKIKRRPSTFQRQAKVSNVVVNGKGRCCQRRSSSMKSCKSSTENLRFLSEAEPKLIKKNK